MMRKLLGWMLLGGLLAPAAQASVIARVVAPAGPQAVGSSVTVELRADLGDPVLGWGVDLGYDPSILLLQGAPEIGPMWTAFPAPDGDGLAGNRPDGLTGNDILLATLHFQALAPGISQLLLSETLSDFAEGFALDPDGFAATTYVGAEVQVVPEPATALLLMLGLLPLAYTNSSSRSLRTRR